MVVFRLLGPVQAIVGEREVELSSTMDRAVLAVLILAQGKYVSQAALARALWDVPPRSASSNMRSYLSRLRVKLRRADPSCTRIVAGAVRSTAW